MPFMAPADRDELRELFRRELMCDVRVHLTIHAGACGACEQAEQVLSEIAALSPRLGLELDRGQGALPAIRLAGAARGDVGFIGLPSGYEFPGLIDSIVEVSTGSTSLAADTVDRLSVLDRRARLQVFTTPT